MTRLTLKATSQADDLGYQALHDIAKIMRGEDCRVIGGHMVTLHVWRLGLQLDRVTADADLGIKPFVAKADGFTDRLTDLGYRQIAGNRFARPVDHLDTAAGEVPDAIIDVLIPNYTSKLRDNVAISDDITTTEVPGLATAMKRPGVDCDLSVVRLNGEQQDFTIRIPDELSSLVLKALARTVRDEDKDAVDIWRCLEVCQALGGVKLDPAESDECRDAHQRIRSEFVPGGPGAAAAVNYLSYRADAAQAFTTRLHALVEAIVPG